MSHYDTLADLRTHTPEDQLEESRELILQQIEILYRCKALSESQRDKLIELWSPTYDEFEELK